MTTPYESVAAIFQAEIDAANKDWEPSFYISWLESLRDRVLAQIGENSGNTREIE